MRDTRYGYCGCGCGERTPPAPRTISRLGYVKGRPRPFLPFHALRLPRRPRDNYVVTPGPLDTPCWLWQFATETTQTHRYGSVRIDGRRVPAHRHHWEQMHGPVPDGLELHHRCETPACVNPDHLQPVTHAENMRLARVRRVDDATIRAIIAELRCGAAHKPLGKKYGVSVGTVASFAKAASLYERGLLD